MNESAERQAAQGAQVFQRPDRVLACHSQLLGEQQGHFMHCSSSYCTICLLCRKKKRFDSAHLQSVYAQCKLECKADTFLSVVFYKVGSRGGGAVAGEVWCKHKSDFFSLVVCFCVFQFDKYPPKLDNPFLRHSSVSTHKI